jgi:hypothetical protein
MKINNSDKEFFDRKVALALQRGKILKMDQGLIKLVDTARKKFQIPLNKGFQTSEQVLMWRSKVQSQRAKEWSDELDKIVKYLKKPKSWKNNIEKLVLMDFLAAPLLSYAEIVHHSDDSGTATRRFIQTDDPALKDDLTQLMKEIEGRNVKPRLFKNNDLDINIAIIKLSRKFNNDFKKVAIEINEQFGTDLMDYDISDKKAKFEKRIVKERMS